MANPRKFSDKLEIIRRKEEEANAAFVKIMREVSDARTGKTHLPHPVNSWQLPSQNDYMKMRQKFKGGSLPNVNLSQSPMIQNVYSAGLSPELYGGQHPQQYMSMNTQPHGRRDHQPSGPIFPSKSKRSYTVAAPYRNNFLHQPQPNVIAEQNDTPSWRRTFSDSAIQQTLQQPPQLNKKSREDSMSTAAGPRMIQTEDVSNYQPQSPPITMQFNDTSANKNHIQMQANTSSLPDLSNLSIPSPIQNPIDVEQADGKSNTNQHESVHPFPIPFRPAPRRFGSFGKQIYPRQMHSNADALETLQREGSKQLQLNIFNMNLDKNELTLPSTSSVSHSAPLSPVTPPPYYWNSTPMSPLATGDLLPPSSTDLHQQLAQFQIHNETSGNNGMVNPPPYPYITETDSYNSYFSNSQFSPKQNLFRINSGPAQLTNNSTRYDSRIVCDQQLDSALMKVKEQVGKELSEADLNSVGVSLAPLDYNEMQILNENTALVEPSAEEQFRLERASYQ